MYIKHINHVVLYAKNFYAHSNDVVEDLKNMVFLDHGFKPKSDEELYDIITNDYKMWIKSLPNDDSYRGVVSEYESGKLGKVSWSDDGPVATMWHILITYSSEIPLFSGKFTAPFYGTKAGIQYKPQYNISENIFSDANPKNNSRAAYNFLRQSHPHILTDLWNKFIENTEYEKCVKLLETVGVTKTEDEVKQMFVLLKDEFFKKYKEDSYMTDDGKIVYPDGRAIVVENEWFKIYTRIYLGVDKFNSTHIDASFIPQSEKCSDVYGRTTEQKTCAAIVDEIFKNMCEQKPEFKKHFLDICILEEIGHHDRITSEENIDDEIKDTLRNLVNIHCNYWGNNLEFTDGTCTGGLMYCCERHGYTDYKISVCPYVWIGCEYRENSLRNTGSAFVCGEHL